MTVNVRSLARVFILILSGLAAAPLAAEERGAKAEYVGGTASEIAGKTEGRIEATDDEFFLFRTKAVTLQVPYSQIDLLEYGQQVDRRYAMAVVISPLFLLSKKRKHFLTVGYVDENGQRQAMVFQVDKGDVRAVLVSLEAKTGRKVQYQDPEARKAGKG